MLILECVDLQEQLEVNELVCVFTHANVKHYMNACVTIIIMFIIENIVLNITPQKIISRKLEIFLKKRLQITRQK